MGTTEIFIMESMFQLEGVGNDGWKLTYFLPDKVSTRQMLRCRREKVHFVFLSLYNVLSADVWIMSWQCPWLLAQRVAVVVAQMYLHDYWKNIPFIIVVETGWREFFVTVVLINQKTLRLEVFRHHCGYPTNRWHWKREK